MDFSALIKKSFDIAWHNRVLWLFGFLSGGAAGLWYANPISYIFNFSDFSSTSSTYDVEKAERMVTNVKNFVSSITPETWLLIIVVIIVVLLLLTLVGVFINSWSLSGLVYSILYRNQARPTFGVGARAGLKYWWKFWLLALVYGLVVFTLFLIFGASIVINFIGSFASIIGGVDFRLTWTISLLVALAGIIALVLLIVISVAGGVIIPIAQRLIIHKGTGVLESIRIGGSLLKKYFGESLLTFLLAIGLGLAFNFMTMFLVMPVSAILETLSAAKLLPAVLILATLFGMFMAIVSSIWVAFQAAYWTLFYEHLASKEGW
ncbi:MAG: hypothetical protein A2126_00640 [Candidatus Woykebacteria bacterium GWB1_45_5]|uniref:Glycerophosphoryl diester phosphodiesterase membrane domain-containing protein n=2 Tax=Candidatus Woykeibacteriota TaxID=1817899 RepID=A0A1G1W2I7_9BACT|nr:MAG: hypothetical protein A2113_00920 [Candidatus Woykebacteria bacterium GWA1_44_8]OGY24227.1 MAG: hypothetical protein A2126_00640 [Candidatus Woykebacteria bacterium GWB1_45_5]